MLVFSKQRHGKGGAMILDTSRIEPRGFEAPPDATPQPPVRTKSSVLPFGELTWENFERLCYRLAKRAGAVEYCARYGQQGEAQEGIDIFARLDDGTYDCWQAKRHKSFCAEAGHGDEKATCDRRPRFRARRRRQ